MKSKKTVKRIYNVVVVALLVGFMAYIGSRFVHWGRVEWTDDAQVHRHITPINARVGGFIRQVLFDDYCRVHRGDTLVIIDDAEYVLQVAQAEAALQTALQGRESVAAGMGTTGRQVMAAQAATDEARVEMEQARRDLQRYEQLLSRDAATQQQYDQARTRYQAARARYEQACSRRQATASVATEQAGHLGQSVAGISLAEAQLNLARLNLGYTVVVATADGTMGRKDIHEGQLVQPGQLLARIVDDEQVWVVANYRETQLPHIAVGSAVELTADALPGITFQGEVQAIAGGTGSAFAPVPTDNATGNFVKVEQRVPVRIRLTALNDTAQVALLRAGLNVETEVKY